MGDGTEFQFPLAPGFGYGMGLGQGPTAQQLYGIPLQPGFTGAAPAWLPTMLAPEGMTPPPALSVPTPAPDVVPTIDSAGNQGQVTTPPGFFTRPGTRMVVPRQPEPQVQGQSQEQQQSAPVVAGPVQVVSSPQYTFPFVSPGESQIKLPKAPGLEKMTEAVAKAKPEAPDKVNTIGMILQALASVGIDPNSPLGTNILRLGLAGLGGLGAAKVQQTEAENEFQKRLQDYQLQQAQVQNSAAQQYFQNQLALQGLQGQTEQTALQRELLTQAQLKPQVRDGFIWQPELLKEKGQVQVKGTPLPQEGKKGAATEIAAKLLAAQARVNPQATFNALLASPQGAALVQWAAEKLELPPQGAGIEWTEQAKARISQYVQQNEPDMFSEVITPYIDLSAAVAALGKRPVK